MSKGLNIRILRGVAWCLLAMVFVTSRSSGDDGLSPLRKKFAEFPKVGLKHTPILPTQNDKIFTPNYVGYAARAPGNDTYGMPGWTRNFGGRFHKGVDILPTRWTTTDENIEIDYVDNKTHESFTKIEKVKIPQDEVYAVLDGKVVVENSDARRSGYGKYVILEHLWADGTRFLTMYCHLSRIDIDEGDVIAQGTQIGMMGQTSSNSGGRRFLKAIPHMHFEVGRVIDDNFAASRTSRRLDPPNFSGKYDPRNMQPYNPLEFLKKFGAITYSELQERKKKLAGRETKEESSAEKVFAPIVWG